MFLNSPTLASLRFFEAAARLKSFKRAAAELHVTQGAVSQQIKHLEQSLGCKLFYRLPRHIDLTEAGRQFAAAVAQGLALIEQGAQALKASQSTAEVRVRAGPSFASRWLVPRLGRFYARHPNITLFILAEYGYLDPARREFDLAIEMIDGTLPTLHTEPLMDEHLIPVCTPEYLASHSFLKAPTDLARCTLLHDAHAMDGQARDSEWRHWLREVEATGVDSAQGQFFTLANMSLEAALAHQGVALGRSSLIAQLLASGRLVTPIDKSVRSPVRYCLVCPKELMNHPAIAVVMDWLREEAGTRHVRTAVIPTSPKI